MQAPICGQCVLEGVCVYGDRANESTSSFSTITPHSNGTARLVNVTVRFNDSSVWRVEQQFLYRPIPRLTSVHPRDQLRKYVVTSVQSSHS